MERPAELEQVAQEAASGATGDGVSDGHIQRVCRAEAEAILKDFLPTVSTKLAEFLREERAKRELMAKEAEKTAAAATALRTDVDHHKRESTAALHELSLRLEGVNAGWETSKLKLQFLETTCSAARAETKSETDELAMQVRNVQSWQSNFTTKALYRDIVDHINATLPSGISRQVGTLTTRMEAIEGRLHAAQGGDAKKRKMEDGISLAD